MVYLSNKTQVFMVYSLINHAGCWKNTRRICNFFLEEHEKNSTFSLF